MMCVTNRAVLAFALKYLESEAPSKRFFHDHPADQQIPFLPIQTSKHQYEDKREREAYNRSDVPSSKWSLINADVICTAHTTTVSAAQCCVVAVEIIVNAPLVKARATRQSSSENDENYAGRQRNHDRNSDPNSQGPFKARSRARHLHAIWTCHYNVIVRSSNWSIDIAVMHGDEVALRIRQDEYIHQYNSNQ